MNNNEKVNAEANIDRILRQQSQVRATAAPFLALFSKNKLLSSMRFSMLITILAYGDEDSKCLF